MINRILIRIKVVQILYSYLLSHTEFKIEVAPTDASRDRRFAYAVYLDMLMLIQEFSGIRVNCRERDFVALDVDKALKNNKVGRALADNPDLKAITLNNAADLSILKPVATSLYDKITSSAFFNEYSRKRSRTLDDDVLMWTVMLETIVLKDQQVVAALRANPDFSLTGLHHGIQQAVDTLRSYNDERSSYLKARSELKSSLEQSYNLYLALFALIIQLTDEQQDRLIAAREKYVPTAEDLNPNTRLVENSFVAFLRQNPVISEFMEKNKFSWVSCPGLLKSLLDSILASDIYNDYINAPETSWRADCEFWRSVLRTIVMPSDALDDALESMSIYWNDDISIVGTFALKTIRRFAQAEPDEPLDFLPPFKDDEDAAFGDELFTHAVKECDRYRAYIDRFISSEWDIDRLAFMDIVIMISAIAEIVHFQAIPVPVSLNEYIEIANNYSTRRSGPFINGILYSVVKMLADEGILNKPFVTSDK